ncbi:sacsin N-terminal ATP-binding-like domain-containing protein [Nitrobacter sp. TKz-YC01]|uniref:sacsin N-terminal ATP-binding-like domain-containing protein n=1 Tax=Nitrobacter sp. TKz-YC01 TaxID=3398703 RepID=UPI003A1009F4
MASNYEKICEDNRSRYGTEGAQKSGGLAAGLYDDRTHFIFELLQNAEDALAKRGEWDGERTVSFKLDQDKLTIAHFGKPFDEGDVRSVCDIAESTKNESAIGRFGLGFKSVYTVTNLPEIHSGDEDFAIDDYVFPKKVPRTARHPDETQIILPLKSEDPTAEQDITAGFRRLGPGALLFLRNIEEINWTVDGGVSGFYMRNPPDTLGPNVRHISLIGQETGQNEVDQNWLVFHRDVFSDEQKPVGRVEIAFLLVAPKEASGRWKVQPLSTSPLVVFFPTVVETHLGFLVQGPFRTTPSRENIPPGDPWNQHLVMETSELLGEAMRWLRDETMLDVSVLRCLPFDNEKFSEGSRFRPMFEAVRQLLQHEPLLPASDGGYVSASQAKLARTQDIRELLQSEQVKALFGSDITAWLSGDITQDKAPEIRQYLMRELDIDEIRPENLLPSLTKEFLETQSDEWVLLLYEFLSGQEKVLRRHLDTVPFIRLDDGSHVVAREKGKAKAFLPSAIATSFPTMRSAVCATPEVRQFLTSLGITEPDPVDDVIWNLLPKYQQEEVNVEGDAYAADIERIRTAFSADSTTQKEKLRAALRDTNFLMVIDTGDGTPYIAKPGDAYIATERLQQLFAGVPDILIVDNNYDCLRGEDIRDLLVSCGASRYLIPQPIQSELGNSDKEQIRRESGLERASWESPLEDFTLRGLKQLLEFLPTLKPEEAATRAKVLWEALADLEARGTATFYGSYKWGYSHETKTARFDASFIRMLNRAAWVPNGDGELVSPDLVVFDALSWKPDPFLQTKIGFKPPIIDQLAREAGIEPAALDLLRKLGITNLADLTSRLGITDPPSEPEPSAAPERGSETSSDSNVYEDAKDLYGDDMPDIPPGKPDPDSGDGVGGGVRVGGRGVPGTDSPRGSDRGNGSAGSGAGRQGAPGGKAMGNSGADGKKTAGHGSGRPFISYVGAHPDDDWPDPDGLDQAQRLQIERQAIDLIVGIEPTLCRTPEGNPGFDLYEADSSGNKIRWVEVKSMTGSLLDRPVGLSHTQFECALEKGDAYWLYVVECAVDPTQARVLRIQNPAGITRTFTFDHGWSKIARTVPPG